MSRKQGTEPTIPAGAMFQGPFGPVLRLLNYGSKNIKNHKKTRNSYSDCGGVLSPLVLTGSVRPCVVRRGCLSEVYR